MTIIVIPDWLDLVVVVIAFGLIATALWIIWQEWRREHRQKPEPVEHSHVRLVQTPYDQEEHQ